MSLTGMVECKALVAIFAAPTSESRRVTMIVLGACWEAEALHNGFEA